MEFHKLESTDGFIVFDLGDAPAVGVVRQAPKVLRDGAELLARSTTYAAASFGLQVGGGSAGINAKPDDRDAALGRVPRGGRAARGERTLAPGPGRRHRAPTTWPASPRPTSGPRRSTRPTAGESAVAAALGALGSLDGKQVAIVGSGPIAEAAAASATANGATAAAQAGFDAECDALLVAGKAGVLEHDLAATVRAKVVVPLTAGAGHRSGAGRPRAGRGRRRARLPLHRRTAARRPRRGRRRRHDPRPRRRWPRSPARARTSGWPPSTKAEDHLRTWQDELPFGRPLA